jgi:hypothetical protein
MHECSWIRSTYCCSFCKSVCLVEKKFHALKMHQNISDRFIIFKLWTESKPCAYIKSQSGQIKQKDYGSNWTASFGDSVLWTFMLINEDFYTPQTHDLIRCSLSQSVSVMSIPRRSILLNYWCTVLLSKRKSIQVINLFCKVVQLSFRWLLWFII